MSLLCVALTYFFILLLKLMVVLGGFLMKMNYYFVNNVFLIEKFRHVFKTNLVLLNTEDGKKSVV